LNRGLDLRKIAARFSQQALEDLRPTIAGLVADELMEQQGDFIRLTSRGRLLSNEVFQAFLAPGDVSAKV
jgi:oxygen-independent coproporphyrinogen-3 oxidase